MSVIKRSRKSSSGDLVAAIKELVPLLEGQGEAEACADLNKASDVLTNAEVGSAEFKDAVNSVIDAFEGDHELVSYTFTREGNQWGDAEVLSAASSRVLNLARRLT